MQVAGSESSLSRIRKREAQALEERFGGGGVTEPVRAPTPASAPAPDGSRVRALVAAYEPPHARSNRAAYRAHLLVYRVEETWEHMHLSACNGALLLGSPMKHETPSEVDKGYIIETMQDHRWLSLNCLGGLSGEHAGAERAELVEQGLAL